MSKTFKVESRLGRDWIFEFVYWDLFAIWDLLSWISINLKIFHEANPLWGSLKLGSSGEELSSI
jgi:hypothetical protein